MTNSLVAALAFSLAACVSACGGSSTAPIPTPNSGSITARIDGASWSSGQGAAAVHAAPGLYAISGISVGSYTMALTLNNIRGPGTFPLGVGPQVPGGYVVLSNASGGWATPLSGAAGTITLTTVTDTRIVGSFSYNAEPVNVGTTGTRAVTNGAIDMAVNTSPGTGAPLDNAGSTFTASLNGSPFVAAAIAGSLTPGGIFGVAANNVTRSLTLTFSQVAGPGSYSTSANPLRQVTYSLPSGATWSSQGAGGSATVAITSITATRIRGTVTGTLVPALGGATGNVSIVGGAFDIGR
ncbi:MAG: hypothetical protein IT361_13860 [Gemmatimonadaceae bacterium]|nr:hypothetical protein [Gemmatimonadaceae bacterium]